MEADYTAAYARLYREHWWWRVREQILLDKIREILTDRADARILDVGCGAGLFFDALEKFGHVEGIESDRLAVEASGRWRNRIHAGTLDDGFQSREPYDVILVLDVLEHVADPDELLRRAGTLMKPGGRILCTVPAFDWLWTSHDELNHHQKRYTAAELRRAMDDAGLCVLESRYLFQSLVLPKLLVRLKEAVVRPSSSLPRIPPPALNLTLQSWYRAEFAMAGWLPFGSSVLAVAKLC